MIYSRNVSENTSKQNTIDFPTSPNKATVDIRLRPRSGAAPWWVSLSIRRGNKSVLYDNRTTTVTSCYSNGTDNPHRRRTDHFIVFDRWRQCAPIPPI